MTASFPRGVFAAICLFAVSLAWAQTATVGTLDYLTGNVLLQTGGGESRRATQGTPVVNGDTVITEAGAYANISFADGARLFLRPNTRVLIESHVFEKAGRA